jgi:hypothetical protein
MLFSSIYDFRERAAIDEFNAFTQKTDKRKYFSYPAVGFRLGRFQRIELPD